MHSRQSSLTLCTRSTCLTCAWDYYQLWASFDELVDKFSSLLLLFQAKRLSSMQLAGTTGSSGESEKKFFGLIHLTHELAWLRPYAIAQWYMKRASSPHWLPCRSVSPSATCSFWWTWSPKRIQDGKTLVANTHQLQFYWVAEGLLFRNSVTYLLKIEMFFARMRQQSLVPLSTDAPILFCRFMRLSKIFAL